MGTGAQQHLASIYDPGMAQTAYSISTLLDHLNRNSSGQIYVHLFTSIQEYPKELRTEQSRQDSQAFYQSLDVRETSGLRITASLADAMKRRLSSIRIRNGFFSLTIQRYPSGF